MFISPKRIDLSFYIVEDETQRPPYNKARNKEESWRILRCILSRFYSCDSNRYL